MARQGSLQRQLGDDPLQLRVLLLEHLQPLHLGRHHPAALLAPIAEGRLSDTRLRQISPTDAPSSACFNTKAIRASVNLDLLMEASSSRTRDHKWKIPVRTGPVLGLQVRSRRAAPAFLSMSVDPDANVEGHRLCAGVEDFDDVIARLPQLPLVGAV